MSKTATSVMNKAVSFLGTKEMPANSNNVVFNTDYYGREVSGSSYPWCASFIWDVFRLANASDLFYDGKKTAYCPTIEAWAREKKLTIDKTKGQYGDVALFDFSGKGVAEHIGFIVGKNADGTYKTVEGNTSLTSNDNGGAVMYRNRPLSTIRCIYRPQYKAETTTVKKQSNAPTLAKPTLRKGNAGVQVLYLQSDLNYVQKAHLNLDGEFGPKTEKALKDFQKQNMLVVDGIYGVKSHAKMKNKLS